MKTLPILVLGALAFSTAGAAQAQSLTGGSFTLGYWANDGETDTLTHGQGTVAFEVYNGFGAEIGLALDQYDGDSENVMSGELHLTYAVNAATTLGIYYGQEDYYGEIYNYGGAEAAYSSGPLYVEAHYGSYTSDGGYDAMHYSFDVEYDVLPAYGLSALGGFRGATDGDDITYDYLGLAYEIGGGFEVEGTYAFSQAGGSDNNIAGIALTYNFGDGAPFKQRVFSSMLPTY